MIDAQQRQRMEDLLSALRGQGALFADLRLRDRRWERHDSGGPLQYGRSVSLDLRVLCDGGWGWACCPGSDLGEALRAGRRALEQARAAAAVAPDATALGPPPAGAGAGAVTPLAAPELSALRDAAQALLAEAAPQEGSASFAVETETFWLANSEGTQREESELRWRLSPGPAPRGAWQRWWGPDQALPTSLTGPDLEGAAPAPLPESLPLLVDGPTHGELVARALLPSLQAHRVLGQRLEASGSSFLTAWDLDDRRLLPEGWDLACCARLPGSPRQRRWDDEGSPLGSRPLVRAGVLRALLGSRATAGYLEDLPWAAAAWSGEGPPQPGLRDVQLEGPSTAPDLAGLASEHAAALELRGVAELQRDDLGDGFLFRARTALLWRAGRCLGAVPSPTFRARVATFWRRCSGLAAAQPSDTVGLRVGRGSGSPPSALAARAPAACFLGVERLP